MNRRMFLLPWLILGFGALLAADVGDEPTEGLAEAPPSPVIALASVRDLGTRVAGRLEADPERAYQILLWTVPGCPGEETVLPFEPLGQVAVVTDAMGTATFSRVVEATLNDTLSVVARAQDGTGATSALSACRPVEIALTYWQDAAVRLEGPQDAVTAGEEVTWTVRLENLSEGPEARPSMEGLDVEVTCPETMEFLSASEGGTVEGGRVQFTGLTLPGEGPLRLSVTGRPREAGLLTLTARVHDPGPYQANNLSFVDLEVNEPEADPADLAVALNVQPDPVRVGRALTCRILVTNLGPAAAAGVVVTSSLPAGARLLESRTERGRLRWTGDELRVELGLMVPEETAEITLVVQPLVEGLITHRAVVNLPSWQPHLIGPGDTRPVRDPELANNEAQIETVVLEERPLEVAGDPVFDPHRGWFEQRVWFAHGGTTLLPGVRLWLDGLPGDVLVLNRTGTQDGRAYLHVGRAVAPGEALEFVVEFHRPSRVPFASPAYEAAGHAGGEADPPTPPVGRPPLTVTIAEASGPPAIRWVSVPGRRYLVQYRPALPACWRTLGPGWTATGDFVVWREPPPGIPGAEPAGIGFYRVLELP